MICMFVWVDFSISRAHQNTLGHIFHSDAYVMHDIREENLAYFQYLYMWMGGWLTEGKRRYGRKSCKKLYSADPGLN